jgi:septum formation protein
MSKVGSYGGQAVHALVLGSASPRRRELVQLLGLRIPVRIEASDADESIPPGLAPGEAAEWLALRKAASVRERLGAEAAGTVIVGADTIVVLDGGILGKPRDAADARRMLGMLQGRAHEVITGVAVLDGASGEAKTARGVTRVVMKPLDADRIARYVATGEPLDKAGAYGIQGLAAGFVERIEGCYFNVVGLPLSLLGDLLAGFGVETV